MFQSLSEEIKSNLTETGELQRAYLVVLAHQEAYDAFVEKHKAEYVADKEGLHREAIQFADSLLWVVFGQNRT